MMGFAALYPSYVGAVTPTLQQRRVEAFRRFHLRRVAEVVELHQPRVADQPRGALAEIGIVAQVLGQFRRSEVAADGGAVALADHQRGRHADRSEEHTSELQSLMRISYAVFCLKKKKNTRESQA